MDELKALSISLEQAGWRIAKTPIRDAMDLCDWYAWQPKRPSDWPDCGCNNKPPSLTVQPSFFEIDGRTHSSAEFRLCGEKSGSWFDLKLYSVALDEVVKTIPRATQTLGAAWKAIAALEQTT